MLKQTLRSLGIFLLIGGIIMSFAFGEIKEANQPRKMTWGYEAGGNFIQTGEGHIGGNTNNVEEAGMLSGFGIFVAVAGGIMTTASFFTENKIATDTSEE